MKRMAKRTAIVISFLSVTAAAWAQTPPAANEERRGGPTPERGDQMEKRRAEMKQRFDADFKKADADGDGALSKAEAEKSMPRLAKDFDAIDTNKDGKLTQDEIRARMQARMAEHHQGKGGSGSDAKPGGSREQGKKRFEEQFKKADVNGDGALSKAEAEKSNPRMAKEFDAIDANKDGKITQDEIRSHMQARMAERHRHGDKAPDAAPANPAKGEAPKAQ